MHCNRRHDAIVAIFLHEILGITISNLVSSETVLICVVCSEIAGQTVDIGSEPAASYDWVLHDLRYFTESVGASRNVRDMGQSPPEKVCPKMDWPGHFQSFGFAVALADKRIFTFPSALRPHLPPAISS